MSVYKELNDIDIDLNMYEEVPLTIAQKKHWERRISKKLGKPRQRSKAKLIGSITACIVIVSVFFSLNFNQVSSAYQTAFSGWLEKSLTVIGFSNEADYSKLKSVIGGTVTTDLGKLRLLEVMLDSDQLIMSIEFFPDSYESLDRIEPSEVIINGQNLSEIRGSSVGSIINGNYVRTYFVPMEHLSTENNLTVKASFIFTSPHKTVDQPSDQPWVFQFEVETKELMSNITTVPLDRIVQFEGQGVKFIKLISSPISTILYYESGEIARSRFTVADEDGNELNFINSSFTPNVESYYRYEPIDLDAGKKYYIVPYNENDSTRIEINP